jgi:endonuclease/exonuclease/phosphatase (EEP) superfamily protein YafD
MADDFRTRQEQARKLVEYARGRSPAILGGDANAGPLSEAYHNFTREFRDAWREAGFGLGHTFPSRTIDESNRPKIGRWYIPPRVACIDYIFILPLTAVKPAWPGMMGSRPPWVEALVVHN